MIGLSRHKSEIISKRDVSYPAEGMFNTVHALLSIHLYLHMQFFNTLLSSPPPFPLNLNGHPFFSRYQLISVFTHFSLQYKFTEHRVHCVKYFITSPFPLLYRSFLADLLFSSSNSCLLFSSLHCNFHTSPFLPPLSLFIPPILSARCYRLISPYLS
jgi:hypothetical protein